MNKTLATFILGLGVVNVTHADYQVDSQQTPTYNQQHQGSNYYNQSAQSVPTDQELAKNVRDKLSSGWFSKGYEQVQVQVNNGNVTLTGSVKTNDDKLKVEKEVRNLDGVKSLNSQLTVQEPSAKDKDKEHNQFPQDTAATPADEQLNKKIRDSVSRGVLWNSYKDIALQTSNGVVTLTGTVSSADDQQKLIADVLKVEGVRTVRSNLAVKNQ